MIPTRLTAADVENAYQIVKPYLEPTRLIRSETIRNRRVMLKLECEQPTGSFKVRGALSKLLRRQAGKAGFVAASAGNHALGVAWAAQVTGRKEPVTIFVPETTPEAKLGKLRKFAIDLRVVGRTFDDAERDARAFEKETGAVYIHAYDDSLTAAGQGTTAIEIAMEMGAPGTVVVPVGGGGLISGNAAWFKERHPDVRIVAVQPDASPSLSESMRLGRPLLEFDAGPTLADGLAGGIGRIVFAHRDLIDFVSNIPEVRIHDAIRALHTVDGVRAEASGAAALAALSGPDSASWPEPIVCIITGANIDDGVFGKLLDQTTA